jgi:hypothetical protein
LEVLFPEKRSAFWKYCSRKKQRILEVLFPEKTSALIALIAGERSRWPNLTFFFLFSFSGDSTSIFLGTVLPFCYFSVVRKVPEKPVLFLPHPHSLLRTFSGGYTRMGAVVVKLPGD